VKQHCYWKLQLWGGVSSGGIGLRNAQGEEYGKFDSSLVRNTTSTEGRGIRMRETLQI
jgi:hypothetical protein